jgi:hypothetical protein
LYINVLKVICGFSPIFSRIKLPVPIMSMPITSSYFPNTSSLLDTSATLIDLYNIISARIDQPPMIVPVGMLSLMH